MDPQIIALLSIFLSAVIPAYLVFRQKSIESKQRSTEENTGRTNQLVDQLQEEITRLREDLKRRDDDSNMNYLMIQDLRREVSEFRWGVMKLIRQLDQLGEAPVWEPMPERPAEPPKRDQ